MAADQNPMRWPRSVAPDASLRRVTEATSSARGKRSRVMVFGPAWSA